MKQGAVFVVSGRVQKVGYRYFVVTKARVLGIKGFVKNLPDGSVYIEAEGNTGQLNVFADFLFVGPPRAMVTSVQRQDCPTQRFADFQVR